MGPLLWCCLAFLAQDPPASEEPTEAAKEAPKEAPTEPTPAQPVPPEPAEAREPSAGAVPKAPPPAAKTVIPAISEAEEKAQVAFYAKAFFIALTTGSTSVLSTLITGPVFIDGRLYDTPEGAQSAWARIIANRSGVNYRLNDLEVLTPQEMEARYGKPPERLKAFPWKGPHVFLAVGNLSGRATILAIQTQGTRRGVIGFTD